MPTLNIASKANQATTFPALLVASLIKETNSKQQVSINIEEADILSSGGKDVVGLIPDSGPSSYGYEPVLSKFLDLDPSLTGQDSESVRNAIPKGM